MPDRNAIPSRVAKMGRVVIDLDDPSAIQRAMGVLLAGLKCFADSPRAREICVKAMVAAWGGTMTGETYGGTEITEHVDKALAAGMTVISPADYPGGEVREFDIDRVWLAVQAAPDFQKQAAVGAMKRLFPERIR